ncbi:DUF3143 domain-containing protein [Gloeobacter kilaueensis]|uniref:DUF3143 domain-containing protein n=1 Tax=Gloeobacter kilaueensis (strain ATCC BAA-2537 / CCAP 1431/1 / ULC 316 / JS1) TaxID=1183438 RepID=U5QR24_GLOK1|nr:DUF3143 domain-containing protein [Gloeobacter kilaueensis]AGY60170.1 hypothetical protein GKIL_3924 [Gloeobacter kilaueensis JS1]
MHSLPSADTPLYNHPLHQIENWLRGQNCVRDEEEQHCWHLQRPHWKATLCLEETVLKVDYEFAPSQNKTLSFPYSLSRQDVEQAIFAFEPPQN